VTARAVVFTTPSVAVRVTTFVFASLKVETVKVTEAAPAGTRTVAGTEATVGSELTRVTVTPPAGAAEVSATVPTVSKPPWRFRGAMLIDLTTAAETVKVLALVCEPTVPTIVAVESAATGCVAIRKVPEVPPGRIRMKPGTVALARSEVKVIVTPPGPAGPFNVTVPIELMPPKTVGGLKVSDVAIGEVTVNVEVTVTPSAIAESVTDASVATGTVWTGKVAVVAPAGTRTKLGSVILASELARLTKLPPAGDA